LGQIVRSDELIDNVAKDMTALAARPALRRRVITAIADAPQRQPHRWLVPAMAAVAGVAMAAWLLIPARTPDMDAVATAARYEAAVAARWAATEGPVTAHVAEAMRPEPVQVDRNTTTRTATRGATPAPAAVGNVWPDLNAWEIPMLPPLAGPPPIVIEPIAWSDVTIAPIEVDLIEVRALVVEPLDDSNPSGV
jgi:hypothetical protein